jgi:tetratricopeptide (TPR) repeat protein|tara:strand:- start:791 stop:2281 length:1491 start_codon:yes stop_codon:yes gene_type:complete
MKPMIDKKLKKLFSKALKKHQKGNLNEAKNIYNKIIKINPNIDVVQNNLGIIYLKSKLQKKAQSCFLNAIKINSNYIDAYNNLAMLNNEIGEYNKSITYSKKVLEIEPNVVKALFNLAYSYGKIGDEKNEIDFYFKTLNCDPNHFKACHNLALRYYELGHTEKSLDFWKKANSINPDDANVGDMLACVLLKHFHFEEGFNFFESRLKKNKFTKIIKSNKLNPLWHGEDLNEKIIFIIAEQGFGDTIQFARYAYELSDFYKTDIFLLVNKKIIHLFDQKKLKIITKGDKIPKYDYYSFLQSLPKYYYQRKKNLLGQYNYISKNQKIFNKWKSKLSKFSLPKIGINWQGNKNFKYDKYRSIPLEKFETLCNTTGFDFISVHKGEGESQIKDIKFIDKLHNFSSTIDNGQNSFEDTIEIIRNLDLVITTCTSIAHLSSTIGTKTWILLAYNSDWRWFTNTNSTPWYKNTLLFRQEKLNNWESVFEKVKQKLVSDYKLQN